MDLGFIIKVMQDLATLKLENVRERNERRKLCERGRGK